MFVGLALVFGKWADEDRRAGRRVRARRRVGVPAEPGRRIRGYRERQAAEHHQAGHQGGRRVTDDPDRDATPDARLARAGLGLARPEHRPAEDGQQRGEQGEPGQQHHADADGQRDAQVGVELEGGGEQGQQGRDDGGGGERDRLADPFHGRDHRLLAVQACAQVLAHPEDEEQAVVRARAEDQHDQQDLGQRRDLQPVLRGLGHERARDGDGEDGRDQRDERREQRPEDQQQQPDDEDDRQQLDLAVRVARLGLLVHVDRDRAGQVHGQARGRAVPGDRRRAGP